MRKSPDSDDLFFESLSNNLNDKYLEFVAGEIRSQENNSTNYTAFKTETNEEFLQRYTKTEVNQGYGFPIYKSEGVLFDFKLNSNEVWERESLNQNPESFNNKGVTVGFNTNYHDNSNNESTAWHTMTGSSIDNNLKQMFINAGASDDANINVYKLSGSAKRYLKHFDIDDSTYTQQRFYIDFWIYNDGSTNETFVFQTSTGSNLTDSITVKSKELKRVKVFCNQHNSIGTGAKFGLSSATNDIYIYDIKVNYATNLESPSYNNITNNQFGKESTIIPKISGGNDPTFDETGTASTFAWTGSAWRFTVGQADLSHRTLRFYISEIYDTKKLAFAINVNATIVGDDTIKIDYNGTFDQFSGSVNFGGLYFDFDHGTQDYIDVIIENAVATDYIEFFGIYFHEFVQSTINLPVNNIPNQQGTIFLKLEYNYNETAPHIYIDEKILEKSSLEYLSLKIEKLSPSNNKQLTLTMTDLTNTSQIIDTITSGTESFHEAFVAIAYNTTTGKLSLKWEGEDIVTNTPGSWNVFSWGTSLVKQEIIDNIITIEQIAFFERFFSDEELTAINIAEIVTPANINQISSVIRQNFNSIRLIAETVFINGFYFQDKIFGSDKVNGKMFMQDDVTGEKTLLDANDLTFQKDVVGTWTDKYQIFHDTDNDIIEIKSADETCLISIDEPNDRVIIKVNNNEVVRVVDGRVGVNEDSPLVAGHFVGPDGNGEGTYTPHADTVVLVQNNEISSDNAYLSILGGTLAETGLYFGDKDDEDQGSIVYDNDNEVMWLTTNANKRITIDDGGNVGINETAPLAHLHVVGPDGDTEGTYVTGADTVALIQNNGSASDGSYISLLGGTTGEAGVFFGDKDSEFSGVIIYDNNTEKMRFRVNNTAASFFIESDGGIFASSLLGSTGSSDARYNTTTGELFYDTSSKRYKENITDAEDEYKSIYDIKIRKYNRKDQSKLNEIGIISEELNEVLPEVVTWSYVNKKEINEYDEKLYEKNNLLKQLEKEKDKKKKKDIQEKIDKTGSLEEPGKELQVEGYNKSDLIPYLIKCIQVQKNQIDQLENRLKIIEDKLNV